MILKACSKHSGVIRYHRLLCYLQYPFSFFILFVLFFFHCEEWIFRSETEMCSRNIPPAPVYRREYFLVFLGAGEMWPLQCHLTDLEAMYQMTSAIQNISEGQDKGLLSCHKMGPCICFKIQANDSKSLQGFSKTEVFLNFIILQNLYRFFFFLTFFSPTPPPHHTHTLEPENLGFDRYRVYVFGGVGSEVQNQVASRSMKSSLTSLRRMPVLPKSATQVKFFSCSSVQEDRLYKTSQTFSSIEFKKETVIIWNALSWVQILEFLLFFDIFSKPWSS